MGFTLQVYRDLNHRLGYYDSITELNEIAVRELIKKVETSPNPQKSIKDLTETHGIQVNFPNVPSALSTIMGKSYIITVYQSADLFLRDFRHEYCKIAGKDWEYNEGSKLPQVFENIAPRFKYQDEIEFNIFEYYRLVRNNIVHPHSKKDLSDMHQAILEEKEEIMVKYKVTNAPNAIDSINFEDFILFTKVTKKIGRILCELSKPGSKDLIKTLDLKSFRKLRNNRSRLEKSISSELRTRYSLNEEEVKEILGDVDLMEII